jgi:hypothetical protein
VLIERADVRVVAHPEVIHLGENRQTGQLTAGSQIGPTIADLPVYTDRSCSFLALSASKSNLIDCMGEARGPGAQ